MKVKIVAAAVAVLMLSGVAAWAQDDQTIEELFESALEACDAEVQSYCSQVTPGDGRLLACFFAHQDKLSGQCEYAIYEASATLERFAAAVAYLANECAEDLEKYCGDVREGEGRLGMCLLDHETEVSAGCKMAMDKGGLARVE